MMTGRHVAAHDGVEPEAGPSPDRDVADDGAVVGEVVPAGRLGEERHASIVVPSKLSRSRRVHFERPSRRLTRQAAAGGETAVQCPGAPPRAHPDRRRPTLLCRHGRHGPHRTGNARTSALIENGRFIVNGQPTCKGREWNGPKVEGLLLNTRLVQGIFDDANPDAKTAGSTRTPANGPRPQHARVRRRHARLAQVRPSCIHDQPPGRQPGGLFRSGQPRVKFRFRPDGSLDPAYLAPWRRSSTGRTNWEWSPSSGSFTPPRWGTLRASNAGQGRRQRHRLAHREARQRPGRDRQRSRRHPHLRAEPAARQARLVERADAGG